MAIMPMRIRTYPPMVPYRPCRYCLSLQDDSVFADFEVDDKGFLYLRRISFDGYGCCGIDATRSMSEQDSRNVIHWIETDDVEHDAMREPLSKYLRDNQDVLWADALEDHGLI